LQLVQMSFLNPHLWSSNQNHVVFESTVREISVMPTLKASRELKNWYFNMIFKFSNFFYNIIFMLITLAQNFKAKTFTKIKMFKIYQHVYLWEKCFCYQLWQSSKDWNFNFLTWKFFHETIFMLIICVPNIKSKIFTQKKILEIYQHVLL